jgi:hypothetical protein
MEASAEMYRRREAHHRVEAQAAQDPAIRDALLGLALALERMARVSDLPKGSVSAWRLEV